ncbi:hypothetical protein LSG16_02570 [Lactococcus cremoris]|uniref:hypothetical protein n=1 Tax=Lactococcus lactis subsp. cremoris TaxID=1359 RepID=UPI001E358D71|nr:hypothetical protein [Lactococcus cremoris]MCD6631718.1 hypothetical protein [Lactococcus cremoris]
MKTQELVLPQNYVELTEDEMMYLDGGWSVKILATNLKDLWNKRPVFAGIFKANGISWGALGALALGRASYLITRIGVAIGSIAAANWVVGATIAALAGGAIFALGTWHVF